MTLGGAHTARPIYRCEAAIYNVVAEVEVRTMQIPYHLSQVRPFYLRLPQSPTHDKSFGKEITRSSCLATLLCPPPPGTLQRSTHPSKGARFVCCFSCLASRILKLPSPPPESSRPIQEANQLHGKVTWPRKMASQTEACLAEPSRTTKWALRQHSSLLSFLPPPSCLYTLLVHIAGGRVYHVHMVREYNTYLYSPTHILLGSRSAAAPSLVEVVCSRWRIRHG